MSARDRIVGNGHKMSRYKKLSCIKSCGELQKASARRRIVGNGHAVSRYEKALVYLELRRVA